MGLIYIATNKTNSKKYVGQTTMPFNVRLSQHLSDTNNGSQFAIHRAIRKYGIDNFTFTKLGIDKDHLNIMEKIYIRQHGTFHGDHYNMTEGGGGSGRKCL